MNKFQHGQRVLVHATEDGVKLIPAEPGTVWRIRIRDDSAFVELDVRVNTPNAHPFDVNDSRSRMVAAFPEDCDPMNAGDAIKIAIVPPDRFGRDHVSTMLYLEDACVNNGGVLAKERMRCNLQRHPAHGSRVHEDLGTAWNEKHGSRLHDGFVLAQHDDWDCIDDFIEAGLCERGGTGSNPVFRLTDEGMEYAAALRRERAERAHVMAQNKAQVRS